MHAEQFKIVNVENNEELASVGACRCSIGVVRRWVESRARHYN